MRRNGQILQPFDYETAGRERKAASHSRAFLVSESGSQRPSVVGAWSVNPRHAVVSVDAGWRYIAS